MEATETSAIPEVADQAVETHEKKTPQESFAELRKAKEDAERQAWQAKKELELMQRHAQQPVQQQVQEEEFDFRQLEQEEYPQGKNLVKAFGKIDKKMSSYEQKLTEKNKEIEGLKFVYDHPDFKSVVTAENIEKYIKNDEDNRESVESSSNPLRKIYGLIKKEIERIPKEKSISQEQRKVDEKENKPKTGAVGVRSEAVTVAAKISNSTMTRQQKEALWKETQQCSRR